MTRDELIIKLAVASYVAALQQPSQKRLQDWIGSASVAADAILAALDQQSPPAHAAADREFLGKAVRLEWIKWAQEQPNPKPSWLLPWDQLTEPEREVDRRIGERIYNLSMIPYDTHSTTAPPKVSTCPRCFAQYCGDRHLCAGGRGGAGATRVVLYGDPEGHKHTDACWEPDSGCDLGRSEEHATAEPADEPRERVCRWKRTAPDVWGAACDLVHAVWIGEMPPENGKCNLCGGKIITEAT